MLPFREPFIIMALPPSEAQRAGLGDREQAFLRQSRSQAAESGTGLRSDELCGALGRVHLRLGGAPEAIVLVVSPASQIRAGPFVGAPASERPTAR